MTVYQWMCVLGIPSLLAGLVTFIKLQVHQNRAMKLAVKAMLQGVQALSGKGLGGSG